jgi:enoyl-CoA hydratase
MQPTEVVVERDGALAVVRMARGELNPLGAGVVAALTEAARSLAGDRSVRAVILAGNERAFTAGADLREAAELDPGTLDRHALHDRFEAGVRMCDAWASLPQVSIAAIEGMAIGGGVSLAVACDWRVLGRGAWMQGPEARIGINYGWGTLPRLAALAGPARAKWFSILCRRHGAEELKDWGVADLVVEDGKALEAARGLAMEVGAMPALAVAINKRVVDSAVRAGPPSPPGSESSATVACLEDAECRAAWQQALRRRS